MGLVSEGRSVYERSPSAVFGVDAKLQILWANTAAEETYPFLKMPNGVSCLLEDSVYYVTSVLENNREPVSFPCAEQYLDQLLYFVPEYDADGFSGALVHCCCTRATERIKRRHRLLLRVQDFIVESTAGSLLAISEARTDAAQPEKLGGPLDRLYAQNMRTLRFARNLAVYGDYMYGQNGSSFSTLELGELLASLAGKYREIFKGKRKFTFSVPKAAILISGDRSRLSRALTSLVREAADESFEIRMSAELDGTQADIVISGNAPEPSRWALLVFGSDSEEIAICDGDHLGLIAAKMIVGEHGGSISLSECDRKTCFHVRLPLGSNASVQLEKDTVHYHSDFNDTAVELCDFCPTPREN